MPTTTTVLGEFDLSAMYPTMVSLIAAMDADAAARLQGALSVSGQISVTPPSFSAMAEALASVSAQLQAGGVSLSFAVQAQIIADLEAMIALMAALTAAFGFTSAKAEVFTTDGPAVEFGGAVQAQAGAGIQGGLPSDRLQSVVIMTRYPAFIEAFFKVFLA